MLIFPKDVLPQYQTVLAERAVLSEKRFQIEQCRLKGEDGLFLTTPAIQNTERQVFGRRFVV